MHCYQRVSVNVHAKTYHTGIPQNTKTYIVLMTL